MKWAVRYATQRVLRVLSFFSFQATLRPSSEAIAAETSSVLCVHILSSLLTDNQEHTHEVIRENRVICSSVRERCLMGVSYMLMPPAYLLDLLKFSLIEIIYT